jgi:hypothetical protein
MVYMGEKRNDAGIWWENWKRDDFDA